MLSNLARLGVIGPLLLLTVCRPLLSQTIEENVVAGALVHDFNGLEAGSRGDFVEARMQFRRALQFMPYFARSFLHAQLAADAVDGTIPRPMALMLFRATNQLAGGDSLNSAELAGRALRHKFDYAPGYLVRARIHQKLEREEDALADCGKAAGLRPGYGLTYYFRGRTHARQESWDKAISDFTRLIEIDNQFAAAFFERGLPTAQRAAITTRFRILKSLCRRGRGGQSILRSLRHI